MNCKKHKGFLTSVRSKRETEIIANLTEGISYTWIGGTDENEEGIWEWSDGSTFDYYNWYTGYTTNQEEIRSNYLYHWSYYNNRDPEPNGGRTENCLEFWNVGDSCDDFCHDVLKRGEYWNDLSCNRNLPYVCKIDKS